MMSEQEWVGRAGDIMAFPFAVVQEELESWTRLSPRMIEYLSGLLAERNTLKREIAGRIEPQVENCANWLEISMVQGGHCYNCANRDGYPWRARPSEACTRFSLLTAEEQDDE